MDIQTSKIELMRMIADVNSLELIEQVKNLLIGNKNDFWDELNDANKKKIEQGIADLDNGRKISYEDYLKKIS